MARTPITWRNVAGASAGNPGATLAGATNAFSSVARGSLDLVDSLRVGEDRANAEATQATIGNILSSGKPLDPNNLPNFAEGVNAGEVLNTVLGAQNKQADLAYRRELTESEALNNDPETVRRKREHADRLASLQERQLDIRNSELQASVNAANTSQKIRDNATKLDTGWDQFVAAGIGQKEQAVAAQVQQIQNDPYLSPEEKITATDTLKQELSIYRNEWETANLSNYLSEARKKYPGMSSEAVNSSRAGQLQNQLTARATELSKERQKADIDYQKRQDVLLKDMSGGSKLYGLALDSNGQPVPIQGDPKDNQMSKNELYELVRGEGSDFLWAKDKEIPADAKKRLDALYDTLQGNRSAIANLMDNAKWEYDTEGIDMGFSAPDEVHGLPTVAQALEVAEKLKQAAGIMYQDNARAGRPGEVAGSRLEQTIAGLNKVRTERAQQATAQRFGAGQFDQDLGSQVNALQSHLNRLNAPKIGAPDPRLQR